MANTTGKYVYRLRIGNRITDPSKHTKHLIFDQGLEVEFTENNDTFSAQLHGVKMNRRIYHPGEIEAEIDFLVVSKNAGGKTAPSFDGVSKLLMRRLVTLSLVEVKEADPNSPLGKVVSEDVIAENYYIHEIDPLIRRDASELKMYVKLIIFSLDKLMTLNKYSKAYVARKLGSGILLPESINFCFKEIKDDPLIKTNILSMQNLKYKETIVKKGSDGKDKVFTFSSEFIHPYLVQYNETFYDFMVRNANRYGEFLYFEDGELTLGLPNSGNALPISDYESVTRQEVTDGPLDIGLFNRDSVKDKEGEIKKLNFTAIKKDEGSGFPEDIFPKSASYNSETATDDFIFPLYKDKFSSLLYQKYWDEGASEALKAELIPFFQSFLAVEKGGGAGIGALMGKQLAVDLGIRTGFAALKNKSQNSGGYKQFLQDYESNTEQFGDGKVVQFATLDTKGWATTIFYSTIRKHEEAQQKKVICINMGNKVITGLKLGQKIKIDGIDGNYVIIQIQQNSDDAWNRDYAKYDDGGRSDKFSGKRSLKIFAIPSYIDEENNAEGSNAEGSTKKEKFIPPVENVPVVRKVGPQTAFILDNDDPKKQGRVRIIYPWQSLDPAKKTAVEDANQKLELVSNSIATNTDRQNALAALLTSLNMELEDIMEYLRMTPEEQQAADKDTQKELEELTDDIKKLTQDSAEKQAEIEAKQQEVDSFEEFDPEKDTTKKAAYEMALQQLTTLKEEKKQIDGDIAAKQQKEKAKERLLDLREQALKEHLEKSRQEGYQMEDNTVFADLRKEYNAKYTEKTQVDDTLGLLYQDKFKADKALKKAQESLEKDYKSIATPWVRVATPMATPGGGVYFVPQKGDEVLVNYDNDNIERPYVVGSLYSKNNLVPSDIFSRFYANSALQKENLTMAIMSPNGHHITFSDPPGGANFFAQALSPGLGFIGSTVGLSKLGGSYKQLAGGIHIGDRYGMYEIEMQSTKRSIDIRSPFGTVSVNAFSGITISAPNGDVKIKGKNISIEAGNKVSILSGNNIKKDPIGSPEGKAASIGYGITDAIVTGGIAMGVQEFGAAAVDFSYIRHVVEVLLRPVDGTMLIKSKKYLKLEAGEGNATIKRDRYKNPLKQTNLILTKAGYEKKSRENIEKFHKHVLVCIEHINTKTDELYDAYAEKRKSAAEKRLAYNREADKYLKEDKKPDIMKMVFDKVSTNAQWDDNSLGVDDFDGQIKDDVRKTKDEVYNILKTPANEFAKAVYDLYKLVYGIKDHLKKDAPENEETFKWVYETVAEMGDDDWIMKQIDKWKELFKDGNEELALEFVTKPDDIFQDDAKKKPFKRAWILTYLHYLGKNENNKVGKSQYISVHYDLDRITNKKTEYLTQEYFWRHQINIMDRKIQYHFWRALWDATLGQIKQTFLNNFNSLERDIWADNAEGQILFSDREDATLNFDGTTLHEENDANIGTLEHLKRVLMQY